MSKPFLIAEVGLYHEGSLGRAIQLIKTLAKYQIDAVKFQTHFSKAESSANEEFRTNSFVQDKSRQEYWDRTGFSKSQWKRIYNECIENNIEFMSSPFSLEAVKFLSGLGMKKWKIPSGEVPNSFLLEAIGKCEGLVILSSGMSKTSELKKAISILRRTKAPEEISILQCTSQYPCPPELLGLNLLQEFRKEFGVENIGLSDHSGEIFGPILGAFSGAKMIEFHVCLSKDDFGPDVSSSIEIPSLDDMIQGIDFANRALVSPVNKDKVSQSLESMRALFVQKIFVKTPLKAGSTITQEHLITRKSSIGISVEEINNILGSELSRDVGANSPLTWSDLK